MAYPQTSVPEDASPLSGRPGGLGRQLLAVKIDNTPAAQPHEGLRSADLVYVQEVEGRLTRLLAVFGTDIPPGVGPVRSARISDISLLAPFGKVAFAYSGAQSLMLPVLRKANIVDLSAERGSPGWSRDPWRPVSYINLIATPTALLEAAPRSAQSRPFGWRFTIKPPRGGSPVNRVSIDWGASQMAFHWHRHRQAWVVWSDGKQTQAVAGGRQLASTVVVQSVRQTDSGFGDRYGNGTPLINTVGTGSALILRNGQTWNATWERPDELSPTRFLLSNGTEMTFAPGQVWILLTRRSIAPEVS